MPSYPYYMEKVKSGPLKGLVAHKPEACEGRGCGIHHPSDHHMKDWTPHWRSDRGLLERICPHGTGHPDPDDLAFKERMWGPSMASTESVHGCDGCCIGTQGFALVQGHGRHGKEERV